MSNYLFFLRLLAVSAAIVVVGSSPVFAEEGVDYQKCWHEAQQHRTCSHYRSFASVDFIKKKCRPINTYDDELVSDILECGGVVNCYLEKNPDYSFDEYGAWYNIIVSYSNRLTLRPVEVAIAKNNGVSGPWDAQELCEFMRTALDSLMPKATKALR